MRLSTPTTTLLACAVTVVALLAALAFAPAHAQPQPAAGRAQAQPADTATLSLQFDNRQRAVLNPSKRSAVINALAKDVFLVTPQQVTVVGGLDQSGVLNAKSVVIFRAVGPATNRRRVLDNCRANTRSFIPGFDSKAENAVEKATDSWWPGDKVEIQKAACT